MNKNKLLSQAEQIAASIDELNTIRAKEVQPKLKKHIAVLQETARNLSAKLDDFEYLELPESLSWIDFNFHTVKITPLEILLVQNGINAERDIFHKFPTSMVGMSVKELCTLLRNFYYLHIKEVHQARKSQGLIEIEQSLFKVSSILDILNLSNPETKLAIDNLKAVIQSTSLTKI